MEQLKPQEYYRVDTLLRSIPINTLFARSVVEGNVTGRVHIDDRRVPRACYIAHPYGMSLLFGSTDRQEFNQALLPYLLGLQPRHSQEWLQVYPVEWSDRLEEMLGDHLTHIGSDHLVAAGGQRKVVENVRVNFRFKPARYAEFRRTLVLPNDCEIISDLSTIYQDMHGSVVPRTFWDDAARFRERGAAFALRHKGELVSTAFVSFAIEHYLELGIETCEKWRGKGFAVHACCALIDDTVRRGLEPVWACRLDNHGSYRLARKLGFDHVLSIPYYQLPVTG
jgi:hypothetical protein